MLIQIDTREKLKAIEKILCEFQRQGVRHIRSKCYYGDYHDFGNPYIAIERKESIQEIAANATTGKERFKGELDRVADVGGKLIILIEQDRIDGKPIRDLEDLILWESQFGEVVGERVYKTLNAWRRKYKLEFVFCSKRETGRKIIELLGGGENGKA